MTQSNETAASEPNTGWTTTPFTERVGIRYPIVQGPFGGGRSSVELAAAVTNAGGLGSFGAVDLEPDGICLLYTSPSPRDISGSRMPSSA